MVCMVVAECCGGMGDRQVGVAGARMGVRKNVPNARLEVCRSSVAALKMC